MAQVLGAEKWSLDRLDSLNEPLHARAFLASGASFARHRFPRASPTLLVHSLEGLWERGRSWGRPRVVEGLVE